MKIVRQIDNDKNKFMLAGLGFLAGLGALGGAVSADNVPQQTPTHVVTSGETLGQIAQSEGTTVSQLAQTNGIKNQNSIYVGQAIRQAASQNQSQTINQQASQNYQVANGDTLWTIASEHGVSVQQLRSLNHLGSDMIYVGQNLKLNGQVVQEQKPVQQTQQTQAQPVRQVPVQQSVQKVQTPVRQTQPQRVQQPVQQSRPAAQTQIRSNVNTGNSNNSSAKNWIAQRESGGSYTARNGQFIGKYQLSADKLHGDFSPANQERVASQYANSRYGGWDQAQAAWKSQGWW